MTPHVRAFIAHVYGHVPYYLDFFRGGIQTQRLPLRIEKILYETVKINLFFVFPFKLLQSGLVAQTISVVPINPIEADNFFQRHIQRIIVEPVTLFFDKALVIRIRGKTRKSRFEQLFPLFSLPRNPCVAAFQSRRFRFVQKSVFDKRRQIYIIRIACKRRLAAVRRPAFIGAGQRKHLPKILFARSQKVYKFSCFASERTYAVFSAKRKYG